MLHVTLLSFQDKGEQKRKSERVKEDMHKVLSGDFCANVSSILALSIQVK